MWYEIGRFKLVIDRVELILMSGSGIEFGGVIGEREKSVDFGRITCFCV